MPRRQYIITCREEICREENKPVNIFGREKKQNKMLQQNRRTHNIGEDNMQTQEENIIIKEAWS